MSQLLKKKLLKQSARARMISGLRMDDMERREEKKIFADINPICFYKDKSLHYILLWIFFSFFIDSFDKNMRSRQKIKRSISKSQDLPQEGCGGSTRPSLIQTPHVD